MAKLTKTNDTERCDFRIPEELLTLFMETFNLDKKQLAPRIHKAINDAILKGWTYSNEYEWCNTNLTSKEVSLEDFLHPKRYQHPYEKDFMHKSSSCINHADENTTIYDKTIKIDFREKISKINFLNFYYRTFQDYDAFIDKIYLEEHKTVLKKKSNDYVEQSTKGKFIRYAMYDAIYSRYDVSGIKSSDYLVPYLGQKNNALLNKILGIFDDLKTEHGINIENYAEPFMGSANVFLHFENAPAPQNCYLNDLDYHMVSLMESIRDNLLEFKLRYIQYDYSKETLNNAYKNYLQVNNGMLELSPLECALNIFILQHFSYYTDKTSFIDAPRENLNDEQYYWYRIKLWTDKMLPLYRISQRLQNVNISRSDAFYFISELNTKPNTLFYIDSPYFFSEDVYDTCKTTASLKDAENAFPHKELADYLKKIHESNNYFVASNRVTVSITRKKGKKGTKLVNDYAISLANECYAHRGFHYTLHRARNMHDEDKTQVEIIVANFTFKDSIPFYNKDDTPNLLTTEAVNNCILEEN